MSSFSGPFPFDRFVAHVTKMAFPCHGPEVFCLVGGRSHIVHGYGHLHTPSIRAGMSNFVDYNDFQRLS